MDDLVVYVFIYLKVYFGLRIHDRNERWPAIDCGGYVENLGGAITMMNMVQRGGSIKSYDCIWLIRPPTNFYHLKTHIYLKVATFLDMGEYWVLINHANANLYYILTTNAGANG